MKNQKIKIAVIVVCIFLAGICYSFSRVHGSRTDEMVLTETASLEETVGTSSKNAGDETLASCYIHICGEVVSPGVYELEEGSRIFQAIEKAGGFTQKAAKEYLNMAEKIRDGMKIVVLSKEEAELAKTRGELSMGEEPSEEKNARINLNTAKKEELITLRGIGEAKAEDIIRYRESHGGFKKIEDIMKISGIKEAGFEKIKEDIKV